MKVVQKNNAYIIAGLIALSYGATYPIAKVIMPAYIKPYGLTLARVVGAALLFWIVGLWMPKEKVKPRDFLLLLVTAFCGASLNMLFLFKGLSYTSSVNASIIILLTPIFVSINSYIFLKEHIGSIKIIGLIIGLLGAGMVIGLENQNTLVTGSLKGNLLVMGSPFVYSFYLIIMTRLVNKYHILTITKWSLLFGVIIVFPFGFTEFYNTNWNMFSITQYAAMGYTIVVTSFLVVLFTLYTLRFIKASTFSVFMYLQPIFTIIITYYMGVETLSFIKIVGMLMVFAGCYLVTNETFFLHNKIKIR